MKRKSKEIAKQKEQEEEQEHDVIFTIRYFHSAI